MTESVVIERICETVEKNHSGRCLALASKTKSGFGLFECIKWKISLASTYEHHSSYDIERSVLEPTSPILHVN